MRVAKIRIDAEIELPEKEIDAARSLVKIDEALKGTDEVLGQIGTVLALDVDVSTVNRREPKKTPGT